MDDTIYALSSGSPPAGIAVIRISGARAGDALAAVAGTVPASRRATLRWLVDPVAGERLDRALVLWFPGSRTATGEDLAELHLHGGRAVVRAVSQVLAAVPGLREALPGEFTRRAFANGVIDLAEAEGLADLLAAETEAQRRTALLAAQGTLSRSVEEWSQRLLQASALVEATLDFSDEGDVGGDVATQARTLAKEVVAEIAGVLQRPQAERLRDGIRVVIAGPPNAGKSTLLNALAGRDAAIVSDLAGTTRDLIEVPVAIDGIPFVLIDSAGLRDGQDRIEQIGIGRARVALASADIILWLDAAALCPDMGRALIVAPKADIARQDEGLAISAVSGEGMAELVELLVERARMLLPAEGEVAFNARQREALSDVIGSLEEEEKDLLLFAEQLRFALRSLDRITGRAGVEQMLDTLFGRFCVGK